MVTVLDNYLLFGFSLQPRIFSVLAASHGPHYPKRLRTPCDGSGQRGVERLVGQILTTGEKPDKRSPLFGGKVTDSAAQHRVGRFQGVQDCAPGNGSFDLKFHFTVDASQGAKVCREHNPDHGKTCASTESTAGRSRTMAVQLSPESTEA